MKTKLIHTVVLTVLRPQTGFDIDTVLCPEFTIKITIEHGRRSYTILRI